LLRPVLEIPVAIIGFSIGISIVIWHNIFLLELKTAAIVMSVLFVASFYRFSQGWKVYRYQKGLIKLPFYSLSPKKIPVNKNYLFLGRGFEWNQLDNLF
jgi:hypothetical protein